MRKTRLAIAGIGAIGAVLIGTTPANAAGTPGVGVNGCTAPSPGNYIPGTCQSVTLPGYYFLSVDGKGGYASAQVNCTQGGSMSVDTWDGPNYTYGYLNGGLCTVSVYSEYTTSGGF